MKRGIFAVAGLMVALAGAAHAGNTISVKPWVYDPGKTGSAVAAWVPGVGLSDGGKSAHGLVLQKNADTSANVAAGATVSGVKGTLTVLAFDVSGHFIGGAPRFNVYSGQSVYFFGASSATSSPIDANWIHADFSNSVPGSSYSYDPVTQTYSAAPAFVWGANGTVVDGIEIVFDEGPAQAIVDNINVNGAVAGKPGNAK